MNHKKPSIFSSNLIYFLFLLLSDVFFSALAMIPGIQEFYATPMGNAVLLIFNEAVFIGGISFIYLKITRRNVGEITRIDRGINWGQIGIIIAILTVSGNLITPLEAFWGYFLNLIGYEPQALGIVPPGNQLELVVSAVGVGIMPALCEEFTYRGVILRGYENKGKITAIVMSALLFALMHSTLEQLCYAFVLGLVMGGLVVICDSLWAGVLFHCLFNLRSLFTVYLFGLFERITGEAPDIAQSAPLSLAQNLFMLTFSLAAMGALFFALYRVSRRRPAREVPDHPGTVLNGAVGYIPFIIGTMLVFLAYGLAYLR